MAPVCILIHCTHILHSLLQPLLEREFPSNFCLNSSVFAGFAWMPSAAESLVCQGCCTEVLLIPVGRAGRERRQMKLCYLLKMTNAVKGNAGKIPGWLSGFLLTHWRIFGKSLDFCSSDEQGQQEGVERAGLDKNILSFIPGFALHFLMQICFCWNPEFLHAALPIPPV